MNWYEIVLMCCFIVVSILNIITNHLVSIRIKLLDKIHNEFMQKSEEFINFIREDNERETRPSQN
jgi:hypothetical protein